jgi:DNA-binding NarL/FixJ family response regulator
VGEPISVAVVDDEPIIRSGLRNLLQSEPDIEVVGEASDGVEAVGLVRRMRPAVVCMDVQMPKLDGIRATEKLLTLPDAPRVLVFTTFGADEHVFGALRAGASGFLLKRANAEQIITAVRTVALGESLVFPEALRTLVATQAPAEVTYRGPALTERESDVLTQVAAGQTNAEIAQALFLGVETVRTHMSRILAKLGARDRTQAVVIAYTTGLIPLRR